MARPRKEPPTEPTEWQTTKGHTVRLINDAYYLYSGNMLLGKYDSLCDILDEKKGGIAPP